MQGIEAFNITLVGTNFPVEQVDLDDFDFGEIKPKVQFRLQQVLQATADEFTLQILPDRFTIVALAVSPDASRIATIKGIAHKFVELYASKRSILAAGHNFSGTFTSTVGSGDDFMRHVAWPNDLAGALQFPSDPTLALVASASIAEEEALTIRLEPRITDRSHIFYDLNFNWGGADKPLQTPIAEVIESFNDSLEYAEALIDRLMKLGTRRESSQA